jgi:hypothetical protein
MLRHSRVIDRKERFERLYQSGHTSMEAVKQKARRGELFLVVAVGYVKTGDDRIEKSPDRRVRDAIDLVFSKFTELQTVRQVLVWARQEQILLPSIVQGADRRPLEKLPEPMPLAAGGLVSPSSRAANV